MGMACRLQARPLCRREPSEPGLWEGWKDKEPCGLSSGRPAVRYWVRLHPTFVLFCPLIGETTNELQRPGMWVGCGRRGADPTRAWHAWRANTQRSGVVIEAPRGGELDDVGDLLRVGNWNYQGEGPSGANQGRIPTYCT